MSSVMKKIIICVLVLTCALSSFVSCGGGSKDITSLSFKSASSYDYLKTLDGQWVTINGYIATSSPVDGSFIFLMNLPYQSCPFCVPNTSELSNTIEVYPADGEDFTNFTNQAIKVLGKLEVAPNKDDPFTDRYGYTFNFKIVDATYSIIKAEDLSSDIALWQKIADSGVVNEISYMYEYLNFVTSWYKYSVGDSTDADGNPVYGYYVSPESLEIFLFADGAQFNYGYKEGYFDGIVSKIEGIDKTAFSDLVENVRRAEALAKRALSELEAGNYTYETKYDEENFKREMKMYKLDKGDELEYEMDLLYSEFANWMGSWEL